MNTLKTDSPMKPRRFAEYLERTGLKRKPHQFEAVEWCLDRELHGRPAGPTRMCYGGLIADEMGLGKTIEILGTMAANPLRRTLIVVPLPLLEQWTKAAMLGDEHHPVIYHGPAKRGLTREVLQKASLVITTYGTLAGRDSTLASLAWDRLVCDEAHRLRNRKTRTHSGVTRVSAKIRWLMTGTPIQNRRSDFYSLCSALGLPPSFYTRQANLKSLARRFILRRTKKGVGLELPPVENRTVDVQWKSKEEARLAEDIHALLLFSGVAGRGRNRPMLGALSRGAFGTTSLPLLVRARQVCVHPPLMEPHLRRLTREKTIPAADWMWKAVQTSSKVGAVVETIADRKSNGNRKLVFSHYRGEIDALMDKIRAAGITAASLDGRTPMDVRRSLLEPMTYDHRSAAHKCLLRKGLSSDLARLALGFLAGPEVLVLQIQTGCEGLNLQSFSEVYFVSPHWNPAVEDQAVARCHRMGQERTVQVFRFSMIGFDSESETKTVEAYSKAVQLQKRVMVAELETETEAATDNRPQLALKKVDVIDEGDPSELPG